MSARARGSCPACRGSGRVLRRPCPVCGGRGRPPLNLAFGVSRLRDRLAGHFGAGRVAHAPARILLMLAREVSA